ncbi:MAG: molybdopterin converting factor subunit 1 [Paracoccus sp. (in: a-proteobacteria)]|uniref:molybdopterin converting factor subunit 1 n=1 Tax=Paracoccus sp. TaxID=267 RepID=UPI00391D25CC
MTVDLLYFAWVRERVGQPRETVRTEAPTVRALLSELTARSEGHAAAFADTGALRCAIDQQFADLDAPIGAAREIAIFPPMTGG